MKRSILLALAGLCLFGNASPAKAQTLAAFRVPTAKFREYACPRSLTSVTENRFDALRRQTLAFQASCDDTVVVFMYAYDPGGNLTEKTFLCLGRDRKEKRMYDVASLAVIDNTYDRRDALLFSKRVGVDQKRFDSIIQKVSDLLQK